MLWRDLQGRLKSSSWPWTWQPQESHHVCERVVQPLLELSHAWCCDHFPGSVPSLPLGEKPFPNILSKPPLTQLCAVPSGSVTSHQRREVTACPSAFLHEEAVDCCCFTVAKNRRVNLLFALFWVKSLKIKAVIIFSFYRILWQWLTFLWNFQSQMVLKVMKMALKWITPLWKAWTSCLLLMLSVGLSFPIIWQVQRGGGCKWSIKCILMKPKNARTWNQMHICLNNWFSEENCVSGYNLLSSHPD